MGVFEVEALAHAAQFDFQVPTAHELEGYFLAAVTDRIVNFPEATAADAALQGIAIQRPLSRIVDELHRSTRQDSFDCRLQTCLSICNLQSSTSVPTLFRQVLW